MSKQPSVGIALKLSNPTGTAKAQAAEVMLEAMQSAAAAWVDVRGLKAPNGAPMEPNRALDIRLEYGEDDVKLTISVQHGALDQIVPREAADSVGAFLNAKKANGSGFPFFKALALRLRLLSAPSKAVKEALASAREDILFGEAANHCVTEISALAHLALAERDDRLKAALGKSKKPTHN
jgi:hypothetical protein